VTLRTGGRPLDDEERARYESRQEKRRKGEHVKCLGESRSTVYGRRSRSSGASAIVSYCRALGKGACRSRLQCSERYVAVVTKDWRQLASATYSYSVVPNGTARIIPVVCGCVRQMRVCGCVGACEECAALWAPSSPDRTVDPNSTET
jgi:hypothetical protein